MIRFRKQLYLFYSGNGYGSSRYATGYADLQEGHRAVQAGEPACCSPGRYLAGPGGATPFVDRAGHLRLAYHAWKAGNVGYPATDACLSTRAPAAPSAGCTSPRCCRKQKGRLVRPPVLLSGPGSRIALPGDLPDPAIDAAVRERDRARASTWCGSCSRRPTAFASTACPTSGSR